jgi:hypothetical protein
MPDESIAAVLNRSGKSTSHGHSWTRMRICSLRKHKGIAVYREGERDERGEATLNEPPSNYPSAHLRSVA